MLIAQELHQYYFSQRVKITFQRPILPVYQKLYTFIKFYNDLHRRKHKVMA